MTEKNKESVGLKIYNTTDEQEKPSIVMMVYGEGGVGKTTFASTGPKPLIVDCEGGAKYFGLRGINVDVAQVKNWSEMRDVISLAKGDKYQTIVIDPIGELMDKLKRHMFALNDSKLVQKDGSPTMAGWGWLKKTMRDYIKVLRDSGKHIILVAHIEEKSDEDRMIKRPKIETKLSDDLVTMVDVVGYMTMIQDDGVPKRVIIVDPSNDKYTAKDRTGQLGKIIEPNFTNIVDACQGTKTFKWSSTQAQMNESIKNDKKAEEKKEETPADKAKRLASSAKKKGVKKNASK